jgi:hypothetical protein
MIITVLAGGWSASQFDLRKLPGIVIAVNDSALYAPRWDICVSMDRLWGLNREDWLKKQTGPIWLRRSAMARYRWTLSADNVTLFENDHLATALSDEPGRLDGTHSGFCALNLAYQMRPRQLWLVGFDMARGPRGEAHWHPQYPWVSQHATSVGRFAEWAKQFDRAAQQLAAAGVEVRLCGTNSPVRSFARGGRAELEEASSCVA